jgi:Tol biopolymer transport system component
LIFLTFERGSQSLVELDLASGEMTTVFDPPDLAWLNSTSVSPDGTQIALSYAPPPGEGEVPLGYTDLYVMPLNDPDQLQPMLQRLDPEESYFNPVWSPDGRYIYYAHLTSTAAVSSTAISTDTVGYTYVIERMAYPGGQIEPLVEHAIWPRLSPDGSKLAYVTFDLSAFTNYLYVADADGSNAVSLLPPDAFFAVDAPVFTSDGSAILFSAVSGGSAPNLTWLDQLLGVQTASAHNVPSDWWRVPVTGGPAEQITQIFDTGLYGALSPDGQRLAFVSASGLYVMNSDGSDLTQLLYTWGGGSLDWLP